MNTRDRLILAGIWLGAIVCAALAFHSPTPAPAWNDGIPGAIYACNALDLYPDTTAVDVAEWLTDTRGYSPDEAIQAVAAGLNHGCRQA